MSREAASLALAQEREDAALEARQAEALEEVAGDLWAAEPDPYARYDRDPVPLSRALVDVLADLRARESGHVTAEAVAVDLLIFAVVLTVLILIPGAALWFVISLACAGIIASLIHDDERRRDGRR
jgi:hypothetical protein